MRDFLPNNKGQLPNSVRESKVPRRIGVEIETDEGISLYEGELALNARGVSTAFRSCCNNPNRHEHPATSAGFTTGCHLDGATDNGYQSLSDYGDPSRCSGIEEHILSVMRSMWGRNPTIAENHMSRILVDASAAQRATIEQALRNNTNRYERFRINDDVLRVVQQLFPLDQMDNDPWAAIICKTDPTCGLEFITTPMSAAADNSWTTLYNTLSTLAETQIDVDSRCSTHVHVTTRNMSKPNIERLVMLYGFLEPLIALCVDPQRAGDSAYNRPWAQNYSALTAQEVKRRDVARTPRGRDTWMYPGALSRHGTIEYRMFHGSLDPEEVTNWVRLLLRFYQSVEYSKSWGIGVKQSVPLMPDFSSVRAFLQYMDMDRKDLDDDVKECRDWFMESAKDNWDVSWFRSIENRLTPIKQIRESGTDVNGSNILVNQLAKRTISWLEKEDAEEVGKVFTKLVNSTLTLCGLQSWITPGKNQILDDVLRNIELNHAPSSLTEAQRRDTATALRAVCSISPVEAGEALLAVYSRLNNNSESFISYLDGVMSLWMGRGTRSSPSISKVLSNYEISDDEAQCVDFSA